MKLRAKVFVLLALLIAFGPVGTALAASAELDATYNQAVLRPHIAKLGANGAFEAFQVGTGFNGNVYAMLRQSDGKIIVGGNFTSFDGYVRNNIARLNPDGTLDGSFNPGTGFDGEVRALAFLGSDIIAGGSFTTFNGAARNRIVRIRTNGALEPAFNPGTGFNNNVTTLLTANQKGIIVGGDFTSYNGTARNHIANIGPNGNLQTGFNPGTGFDNGPFMNAQVLTLASSAGGILVGGVFTSYNGTNCKNIMRLSATGLIDQSFNSGTSFSGPVRATLVNNTDIIVGGDFTSYQGISRSYIARLHADGSLDQGFDPGINILNTVVHALAMNGTDIYVGGAFDYSNGLQRHKILRLNSDGSLDQAFNTSAGPNGDVYAIVVVDISKPVVGGEFVTDFSTGFNDRVTSMVRQSDGKMVVGGFFTSYRGTPCRRIARLNTDGSLDTTFVSGGGFNNSVNTVVLDGTSILVGGFFSSYNGTLRHGIARLKSNGSIDFGFNPGDGFDSAVLSIAMDGSDVYVGGYFSSFDGVSRNMIARLHTDGTLDTSFDPGTGFDASVTALAVYGTDVLAGGYFTQYNGAPSSHIVRLNADGSRDTGFDSGVGFNSDVQTLVIDGASILVGGSFTSYDGVESDHVARLQETGKRDASFNAITGLDGAVRSLVLDGASIYVGGFFSHYGVLTTVQGMARLHADGSLDNTFQPSPGYDGNVYALAVDGADVVVGGDYSTYNGLGAIRIARIKGN